MEKKRKRKKKNTNVFFFFCTSSNLVGLIMLAHVKEKYTRVLFVERREDPEKESTLNHTPTSACTHISPIKDPVERVTSEYVYYRTTPYKLPCRAYLLHTTYISTYYYYSSSVSLIHPTTFPKQLPTPKQLMRYSHSLIFVNSCV